MWAGFYVITASQICIIWSTTVFPILAPIPVNRFAAALASYYFLRTFAQASPFRCFFCHINRRWITARQTWVITISATILQNELEKHLSEAFATRFEEGVEIAYAAISVIPDLPELLRMEVRVAFATGMSVVWKVMTGLAGGGFLTLLLLKKVPMHKYTDARYGSEGQGGNAAGSEEKIANGMKVGVEGVSEGALGEVKRV